ncbi:MAG: hypothetical protein INR71_16000, partial [Terriglobus roseus]|nr:hypothetical protein [Terriglobus roseus]
MRQDLCARHKERHTARGSQLLRKDNFMQNPNPIVTAALSSQTAMRLTTPAHMPSGVQSIPPFHGQPQQHGQDAPYQRQSPMSGVTNSSISRSDASPPLDPSLQSPGSDVQMGGSLIRSGSNDSSYRASDGSRPSQNFSGLPRQPSFGQASTRSGSETSFARPSAVAQNMQSLTISGSPFSGGGSQS